MSATDTIKQGGGNPDPRASEPSMEEILASIRRIIADDQIPAARSVAIEEPRPSALSPHALDAVAAGSEPVPSLVPTEEKPMLRGSTEGQPLPFRFLSHPKPVAVKEIPAQADAPKAAPSDPVSENEPSSTITKSEYPVSNLEPAPRIATASSSLGHIAAPQFAMPDTPMLRGVAQPKRGSSEAEASLLRFAPSVDSAGKPAQADDLPADRRIVDDASTQSAPDSMAGLFSTATDNAVTSAFNRLAASRLVENDDALKEMARDMIRPLLKDWLDDNLPSLVERLVRTEIERVGRGGR